MKNKTEVFIDKAIKIHGNKFNYSLVEYITCRHSVQIYCTKHDIVFSQRPDNHLNGAECPKCKYEKTGQKNSKRFKFSTEDFIKKAISVHGDKYDYSKVTYKLNAVPVSIICKEHGEFKQRPNDHTSGKKGCPLCSKSGFDKNKAATLYYLSIDNGTAYKIGITNRTVKDRFNSCDLDKIKIIKEWDYPLGSLAYDVERKIIDKYKEFKYSGYDLLQSGNTELFTYDILGLDVDVINS